MTIRNPYRSTTFRPEFYEALRGDFVPKLRRTEAGARNLAGMVLEALRELPPLTRVAYPNITRDTVSYNPGWAERAGMYITLVPGEKTTDRDLVRAVSLSALEESVMVIDEPEENTATLLTGDPHTMAGRERSVFPLDTAHDLGAARLGIASAASDFYRNIFDRLAAESAQ